MSAPAPAAGSPESTWDDGYAIAVAAQLDWWLDADWPALESQDPGLPYGYLREKLERLKSAGLGVSPEPQELTLGESERRALAPELADLRACVARVRRAGARAFAEPWRPIFDLGCTSPWPLQHLTLPPAGTAHPERIRLLDLSDLPAHSTAWGERTRIAGLSRLESLMWQGNRVGSGPIGIELGALAHLRILDLERNGLPSLPPEVRACRALTALLLADNPGLGAGLDPAEIARLGPLRLLDLRGCGLGGRALSALRRALPHCRIET